MQERSSLQEEISSMLIDCELFAQLNATELRVAAHYFGLSNVDKDHVIFNEGDVGNFMCIVEAGSVAVIKANHNEELIEMVKLGHGRAFGEMAVLDGERRSATCKALEKSTILTLSKEALDKMLEEHPRTGARLIRTIAVSLSRRLRMAVGKLVDHIE